MKKLLFSSLKVKAVGVDDGLADGQFTAYASVFDNLDSYGDIVRKGAFAKTLADWASTEDLIPLLWGHNTENPMLNIGSVDEAVEDDHGLLVTCQIDLATREAQQVYRLIKGRRVKNMSFAYRVTDGSFVEPTDEVPYYEIRAVDLFEVSVVPMGANEQTEFLTIKAAVESLRAKAGRMLSAKNTEALKEVHTQISSAAAALAEVLAAADGEPDAQEEASVTDAHAKEQPNVEDPPQGKTSGDAEEQKRGSSVDTLAAHIRILTLQGES